MEELGTPTIGDFGDVDSQHESSKNHNLDLLTVCEKIIADQTSQMICETSNDELNYSIDEPTTVRSRASANEEKEINRVIDRDGSKRKSSIAGNM